MIKELKSKKREDGSVLSMKTYFSSEGKSPYIVFFQDEYQICTNIEFYEKYPGDTQHEDKTYMQLVVEALDELENTISKDKEINLKALGRKLVIPRDADRFEIQELIANFVINNTNFYSQKSCDTVKKVKNESDNSNDGVKTFSETDFHGPFLDYVHFDYPGAVKIMFDRAYAEDAKYADKTYIQLVVDALGQINNEIEDGKKIYLTISGKGFTPHDIEIPRDCDKFELQELIINDVLKTATFKENNQKSMDERF